MRGIDDRERKNREMARVEIDAAAVGPAAQFALSRGAFCAPTAATAFSAF